MSGKKNKKNKFRKIIIFAVAVFFAGQLIVPVALVTTKTANAQWAVFETGSVPEITSQIWKQVKAALKTAADVTYKNVLKTFVNNLAYNAAVGVASGDWGQKPLFPTNPEELLTQTADIAAGDFLDEVANNWQGVDSKCYGYSEMTCSNDQACPPPILDCSNANMTEGTKSACNDSKPAMQQCIALGCRLIPALNKDAYDQVKELGLFDNSASSLYVEGAPNCTNAFSLCDQPTTLKLNLNLLARQDLESGGSGDTFGAMEQGRCPVTSIVDNFENQTKDLTRNNGADFLKNLTSKQSTNLYLAQIQKTFTPEASEVGGFFELTFQAKEEAAQAKEGKSFAQQLAGGIGNVTSEITGAVKTPAPLVEGAINKVFGTSLDIQQTYTGSLIADAIGTFTSTLSNKLMTKYFNGLVGEEVSSGGTTKSGGLFSRLLGGVRSGVTAAKLLFSDLQLVNYSVGGSIDIVTNLSSCPNPDKPTVDTCVIDSRFATAIQQEMTVQEAIDGGLLDGARTFGFEADGREPEYYNGYPYRSLVILRKYRIIPVGWELAAKYMQKYAPGRYSLNTLIAEYDNEDSPFYRLINPNWVLKAPELYCAKEGAGPTIEVEQAVRNQDTNKDNEYNTLDAATNVVQRNSSYCADERTCLAENDDGSCKKFGYCVEEEPVWKFDGQSCEEQNNSCVAFDDGSSYLTNTVDYNGCNAENAGCQWYCQDYDSETGWQCSNVAPPNGGNKISFNNKVNTCSAAEEGCTELVEISGVQGVNLVKNSGFEEFNDYAEPQYATDGQRDSGEPDDTSIFSGTSLPDHFDYWSHTAVADNPNAPPAYIPALQRSYASNDAYDGNTSARLHWHRDAENLSHCVAGTNVGQTCSANTDCPNPGYPDAECSYVQLNNGGHPADGAYSTQRIYTGGLTDGKTYTVSFYAKRADGGNCTTNSDDIAINFTRDFGPGDTQYYGENFDIASDQWTRYATSIDFENASTRWVWPNQNDMDLHQQSFILFIRHISNNPFDCDILVDDVQVEEGGLTDYNDFGATNTTYLTMAPDYLNCTGNPALDDEACDNFAPVCSAADVGCNQYSSIDTGDVVNGTITNASSCDPNNPYSCDQCPAEFVGCQAFRELATERVPYRPVVDPISFTPDSGLVCSVADVGCEEYTNLEEVAQGGEGKEYYNGIRQCVPADDLDVATFYTWEGSDEFGYQLKDYRLKITNSTNPHAVGGPCTNMSPEDPFLEGLGYNWPECIDDVSIARNATVTEDYDWAGCDAAEVGVDPDCTEFFDTDGNSYYVLKSKVVYASADCQNYRNSIDSAATCNDSVCSNNGSTCANDTTCNDLLYHLIPGQGKECSSEYAGCRAYKGNAGYNVRTIYSEDFEEGMAVYWAGSLSSESVTVGGNSMLFSQGNNLMTTQELVSDYPIEFQADKTYEISFWAKGGNSDVPFDFSLFTTSASYEIPGTVVAKAGDWQQFSVGPFTLDNGYSGSVRLFSNQILSGPVYMDNFVVSEIMDNIYMVKDSYDRCDGYENCQKYNDLQGLQHYLKSFSSLCDESKVGCQALVDTKNTSSPAAVEYPVSQRQYLRGDLNNDGAIDSNDEAIFIDWLNISGTPPNVYETADVNADGFVDTNIITTPGGPPTCPPDYGNEDFNYLMAYLFCSGEAPSPIYVTSTLNQTIPADEMVYLVNNGEHTCSESVKGCQRLGKPTINKEDVVESFDDVFLVNNPDNYDEILCMFEENSCQEYNSLTGSKYYFKDPGQKTCVYKKVSGQLTSGWYKAGTNSGEPDCPAIDGMCYVASGINATLNGQPCYSVDGDDECIIDNASPLSECVLNSKMVSQPVDGWTGQCPSEESGCIEFRDPETNIEGSEDRCDVRLADGAEYGDQLIGCDSYYYIANEVDKSSCNGLVDREEGCRLFYDTTDPNLIFYSSLTKDGQAPATSCDPNNTTCIEDANTIIKVRQDRTCSRWLECATSIPKINDEGQTENLCQELTVCDRMDNYTSHCISFADYTNANKTFSTPAFADLIKNYSGMVLAGLDWGRRCENNPNLICEADIDCDDGNAATTDVCGEAQIIEGKLPVVAMEEVGSIGYNGDLISHGDFGDRDYKLNQVLSFYLTGGNIYAGNTGNSNAWPEDYDPENDPNDAIDISNMGLPWRERDWFGKAEVNWTEEEGNGRIPSENYNLDENNVAQVITNTESNGVLWSGISYNLGESVIRDQDYVLSFKLKWAGEPSPLDRIRAEFGYVSDDGVEYEWQRFGDDVVPSSEWQEFILGPITAGQDNSGQEVSFAQTVLNIIQSSAGATQYQQVEYFLDDVSLKPVLQTSEQGDYVTRTCRLYPQDDSPYCEYTDENNTTYKGWYGYCLEYDPQNTKYCINWWPIDLLKGESDIFGNLRSVGYSDRTPLYLCAESTSNYIDTAGAIPDNDPYDSNGFNFLATGGAGYVWRETTPATWDSNSYSGINDDSQTYDGDGRCSGSLFSYMFYSARTPATFGFCSEAHVNNSHVKDIRNIPNPRVIYMRDIVRIDHLLTASYGCWDDDYTDNAGALGDGQRLAYLYSMTEEAAKSNDVVRNGGSACFGQVNLTEVDISEGGSVGWWNNLCPVSADYDGCKVWWANQVSGDQDYDAAVSFGLYPDGYRVLRYAASMDDSSGDDAEFTNVVWDWVLKDTCTKVAEVVTEDGTNAFWANHVRRDGEYQTLVTAYEYGQDYAPFGGLIPPRDETCGTVEIDDPETWDTNCSTPGQQPLSIVQPMSQARAGSPYSTFNYSDTGKACQSIYGDPKNGEPCEVATDCCLNDSYEPSVGYCTDPDQLTIRGGQSVQIVPNCVGNETPSGSITNTNNIANLYVNQADAQDEMQRLFVNVYGGWQYRESSTSAGYVNSSTLPNDFAQQWRNEYVAMDTCPYNNEVGRAVRPAYDSANPDDDYCGVPPTLEVTASSYEGSNAQYLDLGEEGGRVQFNLKMSGDNAQVPINRVEVIWDSLSGTSEADSVILGNYDSGTITLDHVYQLPLGNSGKTFKPVFRIVDNWGWCNVPIGAGSSCPYETNPADCTDSNPSTVCDCRAINGNECQWFDPGITIYVGA